MLYIQVWRYDEGDVTHIGVGHSGEVTGVRISPDGQHIVSVSADGAILRWKYPTPPPQFLSVIPTPPPVPGEAEVQQQESEVGGAIPKQDE